MHCSRSLILIGLISFIISAQQAEQGIFYESDSPQSLGRQAFDAVQELNTSHLRQIMQTAVSRWRNQPEQFLEFINTRGKDDWTMLMIATALDSPERLEIIIDATEHGLGQNPTLIAKVLNAKNKFGENVFFIATDFKSVRAVRFLLDQASLIFKNHKQLFYDFIATPETEDAWTPLMNMAFNSAEDGIHATVEKAAVILGQDSPEFDKFINAENLYHENPLSLALDEREIFYLEKHGAHMPQRIKDDAFWRKHSMGKRLLHIVKHSKAKKALIELLEQFAKEFPDDNNGYFHFLTMRDEGGWTAFMNAAAEGNKEFVDIIYKAAKEYFKDRPDWLLYLFLTNDVHGRTPLHLAVTRKHYDIAKMLIETYKQDIKNDKRLFTQLMSYHSELNGFSPFLKAAYNSENDELSRNMLILFLKNAQEVFGLNNAWFDHFINFRDFNGYTALTYVMVPTLRELLKQYGAFDPLDPQYPTRKFIPPRFYAY